MSNRFSIKVENLSKVFPGTKALDNVSLQFEAGKSYALVGENGAGKSTLVRILSGDLQQTEGTIYLNGESWNSISPKNAENFGIIRVPQEPSIITDLSVAENIFLGHPPKNGLLVSYGLMKKEAEKLLQRIGVNLDVTMDAGDLSVANQQMMLIAAALAHDVKLIIFDEPTASITESEAKILFKIMHELKRTGVSIIFISHRMEEVFEVCDHAYVLRDGVKVGDIPTSKTDVRSLINMMVGRDVSYQRMQGKAKENVLLEVKDLYKKATFKNISFKLHEGEILGIAGLMGSGRSEIARAIFGVDKLDFGEIWIEGKKVRIRSPKKAIDLGIGFATEDRKEQGLFLIKSVMFNISFVIRKKISSLGFISNRKDRLLSEEYVKKLNIKTPNIKTNTVDLSGGNQQKVILARWLSANPKILILDEPTRGIDVGAKEEVHKLIRKLAGEGVGILMISSELPEVLSIADRILIMYEGQISGELDANEASEEKVVQYASGLAELA